MASKAGGSPTKVRIIELDNRRYVDLAQLIYALRTVSYNPAIQTVIEELEDMERVEMETNMDGFIRRFMSCFSS